MFDGLDWQPDRMIWHDLVFRLEHFKADKWDVPEYFALYKIKPLVDQYEYFFTKNSNLKPNYIFELGMFDGGSTAFWYEAFRPKKLVAIDLANRDDSPYFRKYVASRGLTENISTYWRTDQADRLKLREIVASEFSDSLDMVIDDCSHLYLPTLASFETVFPFLSPGGIYIIEDWAWGHWPGYVEPNHVWANEESLTSLVTKFVEATGTSSRLINCLTIMQGFLAIEKSQTAIQDSANFRLDDYIVRRPARPTLSPRLLVLQ